MYNIRAKNPYILNSTGKLSEHRKDFFFFHFEYAFARECRALEESDFNDPRWIVVSICPGSTMDAFRNNAMKNQFRIKLKINGKLCYVELTFGKYHHK